MSKSRELFERDGNALSTVMSLRFCPFVAESGSGAVLKDPDGKEYLDLTAGWGVANVGYCHPRVTRAVTDQMNTLSFATTISVPNLKSIELAEKLKELVPGDFDKSVWFGHSGSDANEFIAKIIPYATGRSKILTFVGSYHGQTMGSYVMSGHPAQSRFSGGGNIVKLPYPYCYRCAFEKERESCDLFCLRYIEDYIFDAVTSPEQVGAIVLEAIQCDGGDVVPADGFMKGIEKLCRKYGILLIIDEVKIGFGRTGKMFGFEHWDVEPDLVVMAKPMGAGQPISAVVGRKDIMNSGIGMHYFTTAGNPVACAAALETISILEDEKLVENAKEVGNYFVQELEKLKGKHDIISDVRGKGLVIGVELVKDRKTKEPATDEAAKVLYRGYELGLLFYNSGINSNVLEFTPPLVITKEQVDFAISVLDEAIEDVVNGRVPDEKLAEFAGWSS